MCVCVGVSFSLSLSLSLSVSLCVSVVLHAVSLVSQSSSKLAWSVSLSQHYHHLSMSLSLCLYLTLSMTQNDHLRLQMFSAATAVGMSSVLGAPIGGVMLSIELTSTFYLVSTYWKCSVSAVTAAIFFFVTRSSIYLLTVLIALSHSLSLSHALIPYCTTHSDWL